MVQGKFSLWKAQLGPRIQQTVKLLLFIPPERWITEPRVPARKKYCKLHFWEPEFWSATKMRTAAAVSLLNFSFRFVLLPIHSSPFSIKSFSLVSTEILCRDLTCNVFFQYSEETYETSALINNAETTSSNFEDWQGTPHSLPPAQTLYRKGDTFPSVCQHAPVPDPGIWTFQEVQTTALHGNL